MMSKLIATFAFVLSLSNVAQALPGDVVLFRCSTNVGPFASATVIQSGNKLFLLELSNYGSQSKRELSLEEWNSRQLKMKDDSWGEKTVLKLTDEGWIYTSTGPYKVGGCHPY